MCNFCNNYDNWINLKGENDISELSLYIDVKNKILIGNTIGNGHLGQYSEHNQVLIKYCPMCGRLL